MNNKTGIVYCRVSTEKQRKDGDSLDSQEKACRAYCKNNNIQVLWVFRETYSWKSSDRVIFNEAIRNAIENKIKYFVIFDIDRFSREWYEKHSEFKSLLASGWVILKDSKNIIWDEVTVIENDIIDISWYSWNRENPSEITEMVLSTNAKMEWKKILQRTITKEIVLEQAWYHVRTSNFWFKNKSVKIPNWKWTIQVRDSVEWVFIEELFRLRANNLLSDEEIVDQINSIGYISRRWAKLSVMQMQIYIKNPIYAGVICSKWTGYKAIRAAYEGLVSIEIWNRANKWKKTILEGVNGEIKVVHWRGESDIVEVKRRKKFDPNLPFRNLIKSSALENQLISWSFSRNSQRKLFGYYHPIRKKWKLGENIKKEEFESKVTETLSSIKIDWILKEIFLDRFETIFAQNIKEVESNRANLVNNFNKVTKEIEELENKICTIDSSNVRILKVIENNLWELEEQRANIIRQIAKFDEWGFTNISGFQKFCFNLLEHLDVLAIQSQNIEELEVIFKFTFRETPTYNQIVNRTPNLYPIFALQSQQKNPPVGEFLENIGWQSHLESN